jgi:hypothetical protein
VRNVADAAGCLGVTTFQKITEKIKNGRGAVPARLPAAFTTAYFLFGRWVSAEAAAVFAAALDFGSLSTCEAADAAFALVASPELFLSI